MGISGLSECILRQGKVRIQDLPVHVEGLECLCLDGWTKIKKVEKIKHEKHLIRLVTQDGSYVDVTENHPVLDAKAGVVLAGQVNKGDKLLVICASTGVVTDVRKDIVIEGGYVYNLITEAGNYKAGVGYIIVQ